MAFIVGLTPTLILLAHALNGHEDVLITAYFVGLGQLCGGYMGCIFASDDKMGTADSALEIATWTLFASGVCPMLFAIGLTAVAIPVVLVVYTGGLALFPLIGWLLV